MAELIPFPTKPAPKCGTSPHCTGKLACPECDYVACSSADLHVHVEQKHPVTPRNAPLLRFP